MLSGGNPTLKESVFRDAETADTQMTLSGTVLKSALLLVLVLISAGFVWNEYFSNPEMTSVMGYMIGGAIGGLIVALITIFNPKISPFTAPVYAIVEGLFIGAISAHYEAQYSGLVVQAVTVTFGAFGAVLLLYNLRVLRATPGFVRFILFAMGAILVTYLINIVMHLFGSPGITFLHQASPLGIGISIGICLIAALSFVLDFDQIERGLQYGAPKYMEWYCGFGLLIGLVWLYIEVLRLLWMIAGSKSD